MQKQNQKNDTKNNSTKSHSNSNKQSFKGGQPPREIALPTGEKTQITKEVQGSGQRSVRESSNEKMGTQRNVDPSTSTSRSALDDDYMADDESDRKPMHNAARNQSQVDGKSKGQDQDRNPTP